MLRRNQPTASQSFRVLLKALSSCRPTPTNLTQKSVASEPRAPAAGQVAVPPAPQTHTHPPSCLQWAGPIYCNHHATRRLLSSFEDKNQSPAVTQPIFLAMVAAAAAKLGSGRCGIGTRHIHVIFGHFNFSESVQRQTGIGIISRGLTD